MLRLAVLMVALGLIAPPAAYACDENQFSFNVICVAVSSEKADVGDCKGGG